jgi:hypothetical protein
MVDPEANLAAAEKVAELLNRHKVDAVVIGAVALAAYRYIRQTDDIGLGVNADVPTLRRIVTSLHEAGLAAVLREPDGDDPLGGVIDVTGPFGLVQIVSFADRFPLVIEDAIRGASLVAREGSPLRIVPLPQLIALKLYAGGLKSKSDIVEVLARNPECDVAEIERVCNSYRLRGLKNVLQDPQ